jgi:arginyl-tRNA synthetase
MTIKQQIATSLKPILKELTEQDIEPNVSFNEDSGRGDYSTNVAMQAFGIIKTNMEGIYSRKIPAKASSPMDMAEKIKEKISTSNDSLFEKVEVVKPGFINIFLSKEFLIQKLQNSVKITSPTAEIKKGKIGIEHTQPNTNKPLHIGHVRNTVLGMSLVRLKQATGWDCESWNINNDRGIHICKSMLGYLYAGLPSVDIIRQSVSPEDWEKMEVDYHVFGKYPLQWHEMLKYWSENKDWWLTPEKKGEKPDHFVGDYYIESSNEEEKETLYKGYLSEMLKAWEDGDEKVHDLWKTMNTWFYEGMKQTLDVLGTNFDHEWYESEIYSKGKYLIEKGIKEGKLQRAEDGHVEADLSKFNLPNVVLLRSNGTALYITQDIELARQRIQDEKFDYAMVITGNEQNLRFKQLYRVCEILGIADYDKLLHLGYGMVRLKSGKMSSRKGTAISADDLIADVKKKVHEIMAPQKDEPGYEERLDKVSIGAIKYTMLKYGVLSDISFDIESSISTEGDSGPYIQYVYARTQSVLLKAGISNLQSPISNFHLAPEERELLRLLARFDEVVEEAATRFAPNILCTYLFELASSFNLFYQKCPIIKSEEEIREFRLMLTSQTGETIKKGLGLLGIEAPVRM